MNMIEFFMNMMRSGGNPQQIMIQFLQKQQTPLSQNLLQMAQRGDTAGMEQVARNLCKQRGIDFDKEFNAFKQQLWL